MFVIPIPLQGGKAIGNPFTRIYIDYRTLVSRDPAVLAIALTSWSDRALAVGLRENMDKAVAIAKGTACFRHLTQRFTVSQVTLLGVTVGSSATRGDSDKEKARIAACLKIIRLLACNGFPFHRFMDAVRMFAVRKLSCGWLTFASHACCVFLVAWCLVGWQLSSRCCVCSQVVWLAWQQQDLVWPRLPGHPLHTFTEVDDQSSVEGHQTPVWEHELLDVLSLEDVPFAIGVLQHKLRDGWRHEQHGQGDRRDACLIAELLSLKALNTIDWPKVRNWIGGLAEARTIAQVRLYKMCCWPGCKELGAWEHVVWDCLFL